MARGISPIFYGLPAAIGAKIGSPDMPCLVVCGDGGALPTIGELATIRKYGIPIVILLYNNASFGILEDYMKNTYAIEGAMSLTNPDFVEIARAFGIKGKKVTDLTELKTLFLRDITWDEPFLIELYYPVFPPPWRI
jgi:acetolactate synthase-1/2/3 large subunit